MEDKNKLDLDEMVADMVSDMESKSEPVMVELNKNEEIKESAKKALDAYSDIQLNVMKIKLKIEEFKEKHKDIFDEYEGMLEEINGLNVEGEDCKRAILESIRAVKSIVPLENEKHKVTYVARTTKRNFNTKKFYETYKPESNIYKSYVSETAVSDYVKISEKKSK